MDAMRRCLELAACGRRAVGNGALVGAVLVRDGKMIAEGYHQAFGAAHAERVLLESFTDAIEPDDVLYVNLEPCCHHGKTPPCTDIIIERGIKHVVFGMFDPDDRVSGEGITILKKNGIAVEGPILAAECAWLNRGFVSVRMKQRPWITVKTAKTSDGKVANDDGSPLAITSPEQNKWSHEYVRARHDAILVGVQTIINDNPILDCRLAPSLAPSPVRGRGKFCPWRVILDPQGRIPHDAKVVTDEHAASTILIVDSKNVKNIEALRKNGVHIFEVTTENGVFVWEELWEKLLGSEGDFQGITSILVEGGEKTREIFAQAKMVDMDICLIG